MTKDEVMAMTDEELNIKAAELRGLRRAKIEEVAYHMGLPVEDARLVDPPLWIWEWNGDPIPAEVASASKLARCSEKGCWAITQGPPDYSNDIKAAWKLFEQARNGDRFWNFCTALKDLAVGDDPVPAWKNYMVILGYLGSGIITRAFVMAMEAGKEEG